MCYINQQYPNVIIINENVQIEIAANQSDCCNNCGLIVFQYILLVMKMRLQTRSYRKITFP